MGSTTDNLSNKVTIGYCDMFSFPQKCHNYRKALYIMIHLEIKKDATFGGVLQTDKHSANIDLDSLK